MSVHLAAIAGSLRGASSNRRLLARAIRHAEAAGATVDLLDLKRLALPIYDGDLEAAGVPAPVAELKERLARAQGLMIASPEYNHGVPGGLKNALDWASRAPSPFRGKPVQLMGASSGAFGAVRVIGALRLAVAPLGLFALPSATTIPDADRAFGPDGALLDPRRDEELAGQVRHLVELAQLLRPAG